MVIYTCEKCNKEYDHKGSYLKHLQRKLPCDSKEKIKVVKQKRNSKSVIQKIEEVNNNCDSDNESYYETEISNKSSSTDSSVSSSRRNSKIIDDINNNNINGINQVKDNKIVVRPKRNSKPKNIINNNIENSAKNCEIINGDFLVMDKLLDKISTLLSNSSHTTNIYVKDNATIIYNAYKNDDFDKKYLENKSCKESTKTNKFNKNNYDSSIMT